MCSSVLESGVCVVGRVHVECNLKDKFGAVGLNTLQEDIVVLNDLELSQLSRENWKSVVDAVCLKKPDMVPQVEHVVGLFF